MAQPIIHQPSSPFGLDSSTPIIFSINRWHQGNEWFLVDADVSANLLMFQCKWTRDITKAMHFSEHEDAEALIVLVPQLSNSYVGQSKI